MNRQASESGGNLLEQLQAIGLDIGISKGGNLLRVDNRRTGAVPAPEVLAQILNTPSLRELYLHKVTGLLKQHLDLLLDCERLQVLDVEGSDLDDEELDRLPVMSSLRVLNVRGTAVSPGQIARIRKRMIGTRIIG